MSGPPSGDSPRSEADDAIIGRAFRWSLLLLGAAALLAGGALLLLRAPGPEAPVAEAPPQQAERLAPLLAREPPALPFSDVTAAAGIDFVHENGAYGDRLLPETMGGGVAFFDHDDDGAMDLLFVNGGAWPWAPRPSRFGPLVLYRNDGTGRFVDVTAGSGLDEGGGYGMGVAIGDVDGDGRDDVLVTAVGPDRLLRNLGGGRFADVTAAAGVAGGRTDWSSGAAFFDADGDGDLDLFVCSYVTWSRDIDLAVDYRLTGIGRAYGPPTNYAGTHSRLYENDGSGRFRDVSAAAGIQVVNPATGAPAGKALAVRPLDADADGDLDLVVANDTVRNFLFLNDGTGRFEEAGMATGLAFDNAGNATGAMGLDGMRLEDGGDLAVAVGNFANEMTSFYLARGGALQFADQAVALGIGAESRLALSFGLFFFDADLDGRRDLLQTNGHVEDEINVVQPSQHYEQPTQLFWQCGPDCPRRFLPVPAGKLGDLPRPLVGRGAAYADMDGDGDLDVVLTQVGRPPRLLRNDQNLGHHWLRVALAGPAGNPRGIGARVRVHVGGRHREQTVMPSRSYLSQVEPVLSFGLGDADRVDRLEVHWPGGTVQHLGPLAPDRQILVKHP